MLKRSIDVLLAAIGLALAAPIVLVVGLLVRIKMGRPVLIRPVRPGRHEVPFALLKFRTMTDERDAAGDLLPDAERITGLGRALRAASLDELPSLWNVLRGDMSLVGPRPLLIEYLPLYSDRQRRRHEVRPGITGWAQVNGRNRVPWDERLEMDVWYVENRSLWLDLRILVRTIGKVWRREGVTADGEATMPKFKGSPPP